MANISARGGGGGGWHLSLKIFTNICLTLCFLWIYRPILPLAEYKLIAVNICEMHGTGGIKVLVLCIFWLISARPWVGWKGKGKRRACMHTSNFTVPPLFDISIIYAKYLEHNSGSAAEMIINITLVKDFVTFNILNCKNYLHLSIKLQFNNRNTNISK